MIEGEPDLRGEPDMSRLGKSHHSRNLKAVWSEAKKILDILFHVVHHRMQVVFFQKNVRQADTVFFVEALGG
ncbi:MAG: hypothetical protein JWN42_1611 [Candidatus Angelobacter sp.]|nr:hypothetical protein [Candidatus Angelobacter sp.]